MAQKPGALRLLLSSCRHPWPTWGSQGSPGPKRFKPSRVVGAGISRDPMVVRQIALSRGRQRPAERRQKREHPKCHRQAFRARRKGKKEVEGATGSRRKATGLPLAHPSPAFQVVTALSISSLHSLVHSLLSVLSFSRGVIDSPCRHYLTLRVVNLIAAEWAPCDC